MAVVFKILRTAVLIPTVRLFIFMLTMNTLRWSMRHVKSQAKCQNAVVLLSCICIFQIM